MSIREEITQQIIKALERGTIPWQCPFKQCSLPTNHKTKQPYNGINTLVLWLTAMKKGYTSNYWIGFNQAKTLNGKVRKGEKATKIIACIPAKKKNEEMDGNETTVHHYFRTERVFNIDQIDNLKMDELNTTIKPLSDIETLLSKHKVIIRHQGERAYYSPSKDIINMPLKSKFKDTQGYYSTLLHELMHWTGHKNRMNRLGFDIETDRGLEELIAEVGASFLCAEHSIPPNITNTSSYVASWLKVLRNDHNFIYIAVQKANSAINYLKKSK